MESPPDDVLGVNWEQVRGKILELAKLESKPVMTSLLQLADSDISDGKITLNWKLHIHACLIHVNIIMLVDSLNHN